MDSKDAKKVKKSEFNIKKQINKESSYKSKYSLLKSYEDIDFFSPNYMDLAVEKAYYKEKRNLVTMSNNRRIFNSTLDIASLFLDYPIYFSNILDYRFRMYPGS